jgi:type II secretory pathway component GspD/PulD (secretin)
LGAEGWELVLTAPAGDQYDYVFKRPAPRLPRGAGAVAGPPQALAGAPVAGPQELRVFRLKNAAAADMERLLSKLFPGGRAGGGLRLASDERTNSVLVYGPPTQLDEIEAILTRLDTPEGPKAPVKK